MRLYDTLVLDAAANVRYTGDGYLTAMPRVARTGIQLYYGSELGLKGQDAKKVLKVLRPEDQVFSKDAMNSFAHRPFTDDHPPVQVTADNWKQYATGQSGAEVVRDGEFIRVPMVLMDAKAIQKYKDGKAEISMGYDCEIDFTPGNDPTYGAYDAKQKNPRGNHYAVVDAARGGSKLRIGDAGNKLNTNAYADGLRAIMDGKVDDKDYAGFAAGSLPRCLADKEYPFAAADGTVSLAALRACLVDAIVKGDHDIQGAVTEMLSHVNGTTNAVSDGTTKEVTMSKTIMVDGLPVEVVNDQAAAIIDKALKDMGVKLTTAQDAYQKAAAENEEVKKKMAGDAAKATTELAAKDAEIVTLKQQVADSVITPAKLDAMVKDRAVVIDKARQTIGAVLVVDGKSVSEIMSQVVHAKLGDAAKDWNADQIKISFDTMTAGVKVTETPAGAGVYDTARAFSGPALHDGSARAEADKVIAARDKSLSEAWKTPAGAA